MKDNKRTLTGLLDELEAVLWADGEDTEWDSDLGLAVSDVLRRYGRAGPVVRLPADMPHVPQPCPTCGGNEEVSAGDESEPCPDCEEHPGLASPWGEVSRDIILNDDGSAFVNDVPWTADQVETAVRTARVCIASRPGREPCGCTCCDIWLAHWRAGKKVR